MEKYVEMYLKSHSGVVTKVTPYSFYYKKLNQKSLKKGTVEVEEEYWVMESYFVKLENTH